MPHEKKHDKHHRHSGVKVNSAGEEAAAVLVQASVRGEQARGGGGLPGELKGDLPPRSVDGSRGESPCRPHVSTKAPPEVPTKSHLEERLDASPVEAVNEERLAAVTKMQAINRGRTARAVARKHPSVVEGESYVLRTRCPAHAMLTHSATPHVATLISTTPTFATPISTLRTFQEHHCQEGPSFSSWIGNLYPY